MAVQEGRHYLSEDVDRLVFRESFTFVHVVEQLTTIDVLHNKVSRFSQQMLH